MRRNGRPKEWFLESPLLPCPLRFSSVLRANFKRAEKKRTLQKHPFGRPFLRTTLSPLLWCAPNLGFLYRKNRATTLEGGRKGARGRGVQNPFLGGTSFVRFFSPLFFSTPPRRPLNGAQLNLEGFSRTMSLSHFDDIRRAEGNLRCPNRILKSATI